MTEYFIPMFRKMQAAKAITNKQTGVKVKITHLDKSLYTWFLDRYMFWKNQGKLFFDNQDDIALYNACGRPTVSEFISKFADLGAIVVVKGNGHGNFNNSNSYHVVDVLNESLFELEFPKGIDLSRISDEQKKKVEQVFTDIHKSDRFTREAAHKVFAGIKAPQKAEIDFDEMNFARYEERQQNLQQWSPE